MCADCTLPAENVFGRPQVYFTNLNSVSIIGSGIAKKKPAVAGWLKIGGG
jgi:hypothetical protein